MASSNASLKMTSRMFDAPSALRQNPNAIFGTDAAQITVEGLGRGPDLHPLQTAFADLGAAQCGYCTPGILMTAKALLLKEPRPSRERIKEAISGNLCRCTGYQQIFEAIEEAAKRMEHESPR